MRLLNETVTVFASKKLPIEVDEIAPDGSSARVLLDLTGGGLAHFTFAAGQVSAALRHRHVEEIWFIISGYGEIWRKQKQRQEITHLEPDLCITIPQHTAFQIRVLGSEPLAAIVITMPPWPGEDEALMVEGIWPATALPSAVDK